MTSSTIPTCAAFTWVKNSACEIACQSLTQIRQRRAAYSHIACVGNLIYTSKNRTIPRRASYGAVTKIGASPDARAGNDAAADAGHQAAAALEPRPGGLCRRGA